MEDKKHIVELHKGTPVLKPERDVPAGNVQETDFCAAYLIAVLVMLQGERIRDPQRELPNIDITEGE